MKKVFLILFALFASTDNITFAQNGSCKLSGTKWRIKNVAAKRINGTIEDSLQEVERFRNFDSVQIHFYSNKHVKVLYKQWQAVGMYKTVRVNGSYELRITKWKNFGFFENGPIERAAFAVFLYPFRPDAIVLKSDCSFSIPYNYNGIESEVFYIRKE